MPPRNDWRGFCDLAADAEQVAVVSRKSNLPTSKESGQGDCDRANKMVPYEQISALSVSLFELNLQ